MATADLDERALGNRSRDPEALVKLLAHAKAEAIRAKLPRSKAVLVTCDQVVVHKGIIREKPVSEEEVRLLACTPAGCHAASTDVQPGQ